MEIHARKGVYALFVSHKGEELEWKFSVWATLARKTGDETSEELTDEQFGATNEFLASLPEKVQDKMFENYKMANLQLAEYNDKEEAMAIYFNFAPKIVEDISEKYLLEWSRAQGRIHVEPPPVLRSASTPAAMTYDAEESYNLSAFCIAVKILAPMMGSYVELVREKSTRHKAATLHKERQASRLFFATSLANWKTYQRLDLYLDAYAGRRQGSLSLSTRYGMATADLNSLLKGLTIIRRLMIATVRTNKNGSIVAFIYMFLQEKIDELAKDVTFKSKFASRRNDDSEDESYSDNFRKPENVDQGTVIAIDHEMSDWRKYARYLGLDDQECLTAECIFETLVDNEYFHVTDIIHYPIVAMLIREKTFHMMIDKVEANTLLALIAVASVYCHKKGWTDLAELLIAYRYEVDPAHMPMSSRNGMSYKRLTADLDQAVADQYANLDQSMINTPTNQGKLWIETVIKAVLSFQWSGLTEPSYLRHSLARFIIERPMEEDPQTVAATDVGTPAIEATETISVTE